jgi:uncharacterized protein YukE
MSITIKHLDGPLKGEKDFDDNTSTILVGRQAGCQVVYPAEYVVIGKTHCQIERQISGDYCVKPLGGHYVEIDGVPVDKSAWVPNGSILRLGDEKAGPSFKAEIEQEESELPKTGLQTIAKSWREMLAETRVLAGGGLGVLAILLTGSVAYFLLRTTSLEEEIASANAVASDIAKQQFSEATKAKLLNAVYLVAKDEDGKPKAEGTAWAFLPDKLAANPKVLLATNAHVTEAIKGHENQFFLIAPNGKRIDIGSVTSHPGYLAFGKYKTTLGTTRWGNFTPLDLINEYDVGIIDPKTPLPADDVTGKPVTLDLATEEEAEKLKPGTNVASVGFPTEGLAGSETAAKAPATLHFGEISALTDVFMCKAEPGHRLLLKHSVPVTGGASGSPLIDASGKVIGIVNGGNTTVFKDAEDSVNAKVRMPNAALINFAQRVDLLQDLTQGVAEQRLAEDQAYWRKAAQQFDHYFDVAAKDFEDLAKERYGVGEPDKTAMPRGTLDPGKVTSLKLVSTSYNFEAVPGRVYGFIADAASGIPVGINVKEKGTSEFLRDKKDPRQSSELELAPTVWVIVDKPTTLEVIVWSPLAQPADFVLYAYDWGEPKPSAANSAEASDSATKQQ